ncbi:MAG: hypothetical protein KA956_02640 [Pyrinomonadaceae bacterium]|nr:hypothetical protein [Pyrinomonadaceae bacterium]
MKKIILHLFLLVLFTTAAVSQNRQDVVDDGFTWFESPVATTNTGVNGAPVHHGWMLKAYARIFGNYPEGTQIKFVVLKNGKPTGTTLCNTSTYHPLSGLFVEGFAWTVDCWQKDSATKETGVFDVQVYRMNGSDQKLVRTYKIDIKPINRAPSGQQPGTAPPKYMVNRHSEAAVGFLYMRPAGHIPYFDYAQRPERSGHNEVEFYFSVSPPTDVMNPLPATTFGCTVDGKALTFPGPGEYATEANMKYVQNAFNIYQDRLAPKYKAGMPYEEKMQFYMVYLRAPLSFGGDRRSGRLQIEDHPGNWQCTISKNSTVWRTWRFTVQRGGRIVTHPEQVSNINLAANAYLVDMEIPVGGAPMDGRLAGPSTSLFSGLAWTTPEGKAMAARLPKKGQPWPVPSAGAK